MYKLIAIALMVLGSISGYTQQNPLERFALGSCNRQYEPQPLWDEIIKHDPELWVWLGDNIYGDTDDMSVLQSKYNHQLNNPGYKRLLSQAPITGIWDDHDYGRNNTGREYPKKAESQQLFLDFMGVPDDSHRRTRKGAYHSKVWGPKGRQVRFIFLDIRYFQTKPNDPEADILGERQWRWFEKRMETSEAQVHFIASGLSILQPELPSDGWAQYQRSTTRLRKILSKYRDKGIVFLTGDRHFSGILHRNLGTEKYFELMSSGMTHSGKSWFVKKYMNFLYGKKNTLYKKNYSTVNINWEEPISLRFRGHTVEGPSRLDRTIYLRNGFWKKK